MKKINLKNTRIIISLISILIAFCFSSVYAKTTFDSAEKAAQTLYQAIVDKDINAIEKMLDIDNINQLPIDKISAKDQQLFIDAWHKNHSLLTIDSYRYYIKVGENDWTFPIPVISQRAYIDGMVKNLWFFDTETGAENIRTRRIGRNELSTIQAILAYYDAQKEYAQQDRNGNGKLEYAQRFISSPGKQDGLYWPVDKNQPQSPLGPLFANKEPGTSYHGYYYKILTSQGDKARGGKLNYIVNGKMRYGFALLAWPEEYGNSGIMSFMINHKGKIYEKDMGPQTTEFAEVISQFNPTSGWLVSMESPVK